MITVISPSKTLDFASPVSVMLYTMPRFMEQSNLLMQSCKLLTPDMIQQLMAISPKLSMLNYDRFQSWQPNFNLDNARQAIFAFKGDVYEGLKADDLNENDLQFAQVHLRILSGLYGILRPLDLMQPYRLEMGIPLKNGVNSNLYQFWSNNITQAFSDELKRDAEPTLINLASHEYFKAINTKKINAKIIQPLFLNLHKGEYKTISFYAKKARGLMTHFIIKHKITKSSHLKEFDLDEYTFDDSRSDASKFVFVRN